MSYFQQRHNHKISHGTVSSMQYRRVCLISGCAQAVLHCIYVRKQSYVTKLSACWPVCPVSFLKNQSFRHGYVTYQIKHSLVCFGVVLSVCPSFYLSFHTCNMSIAKVNTRKDIVRTHLCPVGLVSHHLLVVNSYILCCNDLSVMVSSSSL